MRGVSYHLSYLTYGSNSFNSSNSLNSKQVELTKLEITILSPWLFSALAYPYCDRIAGQVRYLPTHSG